MTNSNGNRDNEMETIRQLLIATASRAEATDARLERLVENQERTQRQLDQRRCANGAQFLEKFCNNQQRFV